MAPLALYRAYRPLHFEDVVGQEHIITALSQSIKSQSIAHAYLFCGSRGTGKTTLAKIFARAINCLEADQGNPPCNHCEICVQALNGSLIDIIEMDAASNNSVDNIRRLCEEAVYLPTQAKYKVYIIDEVHMLSQGAFNALLKTLEEPPAHVVFLLATTDPQRIPATILSRCQRYNLQALSEEQIVGRLQWIAEQNDIHPSADALNCLAQLAKGGMRDAISLLDQCRSRFGAQSFQREDVLALVGQLSDALLMQLGTAYAKRDLASCLLLLADLHQQGRDFVRINGEFLQLLRDLLLCLILPQPARLLPYSPSRIEQLRSLAQLFDRRRIQEDLMHFSALSSQLKQSENPSLLLEIKLIERMAASSVAPPSSRPMPEGKTSSVPVNTAVRSQAPSSSSPLLRSAEPIPASSQPLSPSSKPFPPSPGGARFEKAELKDRLPLTSTSAPSVQTQPPRQLDGRSGRRGD